MKRTINIDKRLLWIGGGIAILGSLYFLLRNDDDKDDNQRSSISRFIPSSNSRFCKYGDSYPLKYGSCGTQVADLQIALKRLGANLGTTGKNGDGVDGMFGNKTRSALYKLIGKDVFVESDIYQINAMYHARQS